VDTLFLTVVGMLHVTFEWFVLKLQDVSRIS